MAEYRGTQPIIDSVRGETPYQKVKIEIDQAIKDFRDGIVGGPDVRFRDELQKIFDGYAANVLNRRFTPTIVRIPNGPVTRGNHPALQLLLPPIKVFCDQCDDREAFSPLWFVDVADPALELNEKYAPFGQLFPDSYQLFFLSYQCQRCKAHPIGFLVKRDKLSLSLDGRSPIEQVEIPAYIPKIESRYFRDALIAIHGGKTLAALFYLRLFLEQFARRQTGIKERKTGEEIMAEYGAGLPEKIRDSMPSLREWYSKLSEALHEAREDADLFEQARSEIERHFDMRRVHRISDNAINKMSSNER